MLFQKPPVRLRGGRVGVVFLGSTVCVSCFWRVSATAIGWFEEGNQKAQHVLVAVVFLGALGTNPDDPNGFPEASQVARG